MQPLFSKLIFAESYIKAISWTLLHSLWQGMILALVAGCIIYFTKNKTPALRYNLLTGAMLLFIIGCCVMFMYQFTNAQAADELLLIDSNVTDQLPAIAIVAFNESNQSITQMWIDFFNTNAHWIVLGWLAIIFIKSIQLSAGFYRIYELKRKELYSVGDYWNNKLISLCGELTITRPVKLMQSGLTKVPAVVGYFKPVILLPIGMVNSLSPSETEAIVLHELAHIGRRDYLVNMLQSFIEIFFFFNPAVLWVSAILKTERENCCDDIALHKTACKKSYIQALVAFEDLSIKNNQSLIPAFAGEKNQLLNRVKRIIYNNNKTLNNMEKKLLAAGLIVTSLFIFAFTSNGLQNKIKSKADKPSADKVTTNAANLAGETLVTDTVPDVNSNNQSTTKETITKNVDGKKYKVVTDDDKVAEVYVDDKKVAAADMVQYSAIVEKLVAEAMHDRMLSKEDMENVEIEMHLSKKEIAEMEKDIREAKLEIEQAHKDAIKDIEAAQKEIELANHDVAFTDAQKKEVAEALELAKVQVAKEINQAKNQIEQAKLQIAQSQEDMKAAKIAIEKSQKEIAVSKKMQEDIVTDFISQQLIKDKDDLSSYQLSNDELIINGVKQPAVVHKKFKEKYVKDKHWKMSYNN
ncbi:MAG: M56 family metallopeptidase [Ferruginibacter sp.]